MEQLDQTLLDGFRAGEDFALQQIVALYQRGMFLYVLRMVRNESDAEEIVQEAFLRAYRSRNSFRGDSALKTWLYRIASNLSLNHLNKRKRESVSEEITAVDERTGALDEMLTDERLAATREALETLPPKQRQVLTLRVYEGKSLKEIAEILDSPLGTVKANLFHAIKNMKKRLKPMFPDEVTP